MRFGKRLAEVTQSGSAGEPYIAYKELKHTVSKLAALIGAGGGRVGVASSEDEEIEGAAASHSAGAGATASARGSAARSSGGSSAAAAAAAAAAGVHADSDDALGSLAAPVEALQQAFFRRIDADVRQAKFYVQRTIAALEASVGEWQSSAIFAGVLFTPAQLEDVAGSLPFQTENKPALVEWLTGLQADSKKEAVAQSLIQKYNNVVTIVNEVLQYIEVNLTAIRKIFKKFEKKLPAAFRIRKVCDYTAHHELFLPAMQHLLVTVVQMQRIICNLPGSQVGRSEALPLARLGPESMSLVSFLRGPLTRDDTLPAHIDVYAKPSADVMSAASASTSAPRQPAPKFGVEGEIRGSGVSGLGASGAGISASADKVPASGQAAGGMSGPNSTREERDAPGGGGRGGRRGRAGRGGAGRGAGRQGGAAQPGQRPPDGAGWGGHSVGGACGGGGAGMGGPAHPPDLQSYVPGWGWDVGWGGAHMGAHMGFGQPGTFAPQGQFWGAAQVPMYAGKGGSKGQAAWPHPVHGKGRKKGAEQPLPDMATQPAQGAPGFVPVPMPQPFFWSGMPLIGSGGAEGEDPYARRP